MKIKNIIATCLIILTVLLHFGLNSRAQRQATQKQNWEYKLTRGLNEIQLNELGAQGWELVEVSVSPESNYTYYLKRAK